MLSDLYVSLFVDVRSLIILSLIKIDPDIGSRKPQIRDKRVVLPEPLSPRNKTFFPLPTSSLGTNILKLLFLDH